jgi:hypothetical protein
MDRKTSAKAQAQLPGSFAEVPKPSSCLSATAIAERASLAPAQVGCNQANAALRTICDLGGRIYN